MAASFTPKTVSSYYNNASYGMSQDDMENCCPERATVVAVNYEANTIDIELVSDSTQFNGIKYICHTDIDYYSYIHNGLPIPANPETIFSHTAHCFISPSGNVTVVAMVVVDPDTGAKSCSIAVPYSTGEGVCRGATYWVYYEFTVNVLQADQTYDQKVFVWDVFREQLAEIVNAAGDGLVTFPCDASEISHWQSGWRTLVAASGSGNLVATDIERLLYSSGYEWDEYDYDSGTITDLQEGYPTCHKVTSREVIDEHTSKEGEVPAYPPFLPIAYGHYYSYTSYHSDIYYNASGGSCAWASINHGTYTENNTMTQDYSVDPGGYLWKLEWYGVNVGEFSKGRNLAYEYDRTVTYTGALTDDLREYVMTGYITVQAPGLNRQFTYSGEGTQYIDQAGLEDKEDINSIPTIITFSYQGAISAGADSLDLFKAFAILAISVPVYMENTYYLKEDDVEIENTTDYDFVFGSVCLEANMYTNDPTADLPANLSRATALEAMLNTLLDSGYYWPGYYTNISGFNISYGAYDNRIRGL